MVDLSHITEADKAYLAGIIDGEGCIDINVRRGKCGVGTHSARLVITQSNQPFLVYLKDMWGGLGSVHGLGGDRPGKKIYRWSITNNQCVFILRQALQYLRIKRPQADLAIELQLSRNKNGARLSQETLDYRGDIKRKVSDLNRMEYIYDA